MVYLKSSFYKLVKALGTSLTSGFLELLRIEKQFL